MTQLSTIRKEAKSLSFGTDPFQELFYQKSKTADRTESVRAMQIDRSGCIVKTTNYLCDTVVETSVFVPGVRVQDIVESGEVVGRKLIHI